MYNKNKYVRFDDDTFVVFSNEIAHIYASQGPMKLGKWEPKTERRKPISAGFISLSKAGVFCEGASESLGLISLPDDTELLRKFFGF